MIMSRIPFVAMAVLSILVALVSFRFLALGLPLAFPDMQGHIDNARLAFVLHITFAPIALFLGTLQLMPKLRQKYRSMHRWGGRFYGMAVLIGGLSGLVVASNAEGGIVATLGFGALSLVWLYTTYQGVRFARARDYTAHRLWMIRSFALTFAGVTLRLYLVGFFIAGFNYTEASVYLAWLCWVPNLIAVEWWMRRRKAAPVR